MPGASLMAQKLKNLPTVLRPGFDPLGREELLEKGMTTLQCFHLGNPQQRSLAGTAPELKRVRHS